MEAAVSVELVEFPTGFGLLFFFFAGSPTVHFALPARFVRVLLVLQRCMEKDMADATIPLEAKGFRKADAIAQLYDEVSPDKTTMTRYLSDICLMIENGQGTVPLIDRVPYWGARLCHDLKVTRLQTGPSTPPPTQYNGVDLSQLRNKRLGRRTADPKSS